MSYRGGRYPPGGGGGGGRDYSNSGRASNHKAPSTPPPQPGGVESMTPPIPGALPQQPPPEIKKHHENFQMLLQDMGLDFKSYQGLTRGDATVKAVSNQYCMPAEDSIACVDPTLGLLILVLHSAQHTPVPTCVQWLRLYRDIQMTVASGAFSSSFISENRMGVSIQNHAKIIDMANQAVKFLDTEIPWDQPEALSSLPRHIGQDFVRKLFILLDEQSGLRGQNQSPSCRRVQSDPKGMLCNLFLTGSSGKPGGGCQQGFLCNQIHMNASKAWERRGFFFTSLASALLERGVRHQEVMHRVKDAVFYAKYANKVSLKVQSGYVIYFKTSYTRGRLSHALGFGGLCPAKGNAALCMFGESCEGIHIGDSHGVNAVKSSEPLDASVMDELEKECATYMLSARPSSYTVLERRPGAVDSPAVIAAQQWSNWTGAAKPKEIDPQLLSQLAGVARSPGVARNESMTPVLDELYQHHGFSSGEGLDSTGESPLKAMGQGGPDTPIHVSGGPLGTMGSSHPGLMPVKLNTN